MAENTKKQCKPFENTIDMEEKQTIFTMKCYVLDKAAAGKCCQENPRSRQEFLVHN